MYSLLPSTLITSHKRKTPYLYLPSLLIIFPNYSFQMKYGGGTPSALFRPVLCQNDTPVTSNSFTYYIYFFFLIFLTSACQEWRARNRGWALPSLRGYPPHKRIGGNALENPALNTVLCSVRSPSYK